MFALDMLDVPQYYASVVVAQANQAQAIPVAKERAMGVCFGVDYNPAGQEHSSLLSPEYAAASYFSLYENLKVDKPPLSNVELVVHPTHGKVIYPKYKDGLLHPTYVPDSGYVGDDKIVFNVNVDGVMVRVVYLLKVTKLFADSEGVHDFLCRETGAQWKISIQNIQLNAKCSVS